MDSIEQSTKSVKSKSDKLDSLLTDLAASAKQMANEISSTRQLNDSIQNQVNSILLKNSEFLHKIDSLRLTYEKAAEYESYKIQQENPRIKIHSSKYLKMNLSIPMVSFSFYNEGSRPAKDLTYDIKCIVYNRKTQKLMLLNRNLSEVSDLSPNERVHSSMPVIIQTKDTTNYDVLLKVNWRWTDEFNNTTLTDSTYMYTRIIEGFGSRISLNGFNECSNNEINRVFEDIQVKEAFKKEIMYIGDYKITLCLHRK